jgi:hypothetical protein
MWKIFLFLFLFSLSLSAAQDVQHSQLLLMLEILNSSDQSIDSLETSTADSNQITNELSAKANSMQTTISLQQRRLQQESASFQIYKQEAQEKFNGYEAAISSLEASFKASLTRNQEQEREISKLKIQIAEMKTTIVIMGAVLAAIAAGAVIRLVMKLKSFGSLGLIKKH